MNKKELIKIITETTDYWQPCGENDACHIIHERKPFLWRISPKWAGEVADRILEAMKEEICQKK